MIFICLYWSICEKVARICVVTVGMCLWAWLGELLVRQDLYQPTVRSAIPIPLEPTICTLMKYYSFILTPTLDDVNRRLSVCWNTIFIYSFGGLARMANIESSEVWGTYCLPNYLIYFIYKQLLCGKFPKPLTIQYLLTDGGWVVLCAWGKWCILIRLVYMPE